MSKINIRTVIILIVIFFISLITITSLPVYMYYKNFKNRPLSTDPEQWGQFGDFIGGTLNPILAIVNTVVLVILTYVVWRSDTHRDLDNKSHEKRLALFSEFQFSLREFLALQTDLMVELSSLGAFEDSEIHSRRTRLNIVMLGLFSQYGPLLKEGKYIEWLNEIPDVVINEENRKDYSVFLTRCSSVNRKVIEFLSNKIADRWR